MILSRREIQRANIIRDGVVPHRRTFCGLSYGPSVAGYDIRCKQDRFMWPGRFVLASTVESFDMPKHVLGVVHDKSTWARRGLSVFNTVIEPGWRGYLTLELKMQAWRPVWIRAHDPIAQVVFHCIANPVPGGYSGKYQDQGDYPVGARDEQTTW